MGSWAWVISPRVCRRSSQQGLQCYFGKCMGFGGRNLASRCFNSAVYSNPIVLLTSLASKIAYNIPQQATGQSVNQQSTAADWSGGWPPTFLSAAAPPRPGLSVGPLCCSSTPGRIHAPIDPQGPLLHDDSCLHLRRGSESSKGPAQTSRIL